MATLTDLHNPSFVQFPINNLRTAWRNVALPVILVVPHRRDADGTGIPNSAPQSVRIYIEDVPREAKVAAHPGVRFPDRELYSNTIDSLELAAAAIDVSILTIRKADGTEVDIADAEDGDLVEYTTGSGVTDTFPYLVGADYFDLSEAEIDVELLPDDRYNLVYEAQYFNRVVSQDGRLDFLCIDANTLSVTRLGFKIDHPGKIMAEFYRNTPAVLLTDTSPAHDTTVSFYRPFTDILQDVVDEQDLLERINWVFDAPPEAIPYLSSLLGWDIPYFPQSLDELRRAVLRRTVEFQNLKGSRRAIIQLFRLFGFEVLISNLWWSSDGKRLIRPDEVLSSAYADEAIVTEAHDQIDLLLSDYDESGFGDFQIPLLHRPQEKNGLDQFTALRDGGNVTVLAYAVEKDSEAHVTLQAIAAAIADAPSEFGDEAGCEGDFLFPTSFQEALDGMELTGYSQIHISGKMGQSTEETLVGPTIPLIGTGVSLNRETNVLTLTLNGSLDLTDHAIFAFAVYRRYEFNVPEALADLQSNRFDLQVLTQSLAEFADPATLDFALDFVYRLKAFHSLLNVIRTRIELTETYQVSDMCVGGEFEQRYDIDVGRLQVPPAIIPDVPADLNDCSLLDPRTLGYKDADIQYRIRVLTNLLEEHKVWKAQDDREEGDGTVESAPATPGRTDCLYTPWGQDRITVQERVEVRDVTPSPHVAGNMVESGFPNDVLATTSDSQNADASAYGSFTRERTAVRDPHCTLDKVTDYCYKGRVDDELLYRPTLLNRENSGLKPVHLPMGRGVYWSFPSLSTVAQPGVRRPADRSHTQKIKFTGLASEVLQSPHRTGIQKDYLETPYHVKMPAKHDSLLGRLYRDYGMRGRETLHYSDRRAVFNPDQKMQLALMRPELEVFKPILHLPGCRFPKMNALEVDFTHPTYRARPWDANVCGPNLCNTDPNFLNFRMEVGSDGSEHLVFDDEPYTVHGNGLLPDVPTLGNHTLGSEAVFAAEDVIHKVYMKGADDSPYITFDQVCDLDSTVVDRFLEPATPLFPSYNECGSGYIDYADGYPCVYGYQIYTPVDIGREGLYEAVFDGLGIPSQNGTDAPGDVLFLLGSGIRIERGVRLDGGCLLASCDETADGDALCTMDQMLNDDGDYDFDPDHLTVEACMLNVEEIGVASVLLDGSISSLLETV
jgi:hypothetical protein